MKVHYANGKYVVCKGRRKFVLSSYMAAKACIETPERTWGDFLKAAMGGAMLAGGFYALYVVSWAMAGTGF